ATCSPPRSGAATGSSEGVTGLPHAAEARVVELLVVPAVAASRGEDVGGGFLVETAAAGHVRARLPARRAGPLPDVAHEIHEAARRRAGGVRADRARLGFLPADLGLRRR